jgi:hypothetical protein
MMKRLLTALAVATLAIAAAPSPAHAKRPGAAKREKVKQQVRAMRAWILTEELGLDDTTAGKLVPVLARFDDEMARLLDERAQLRRDLAAAEGGDPRVLDGLIDRLVANQRARWALEEQRFADLRRLLTPTQTARLVDILPDLDRRILRGMRRAGRGDAGLDDDGPPVRPRPRRGRAHRARPGDLKNPFDTRE